MFALIRKLGYARVFFFLGENCADANAGDGRLFLHISNPGWQQASSSQSVANGVLTKRASRITKIRTNLSHSLSLSLSNTYTISLFLLVTHTHYHTISYPHIIQTRIGTSLHDSIHHHTYYLSHRHNNTYFSLGNFCTL